MSPRRWQERVQDILDAIVEIRTFVGVMDYKEFRDDQKTMRAVELNLIIIGEAVNSVPDEILETYPQVDWHLMRGLRNRLVHTYFSISPKILWDTVQQDLPHLVSVLERIIQENH
jgi:uncharacterized protein with HEPN domain